MAAKPASDAEWVRQMERRVAALERAQVVRVGDWTLSQRADGNLVAQNGRTGRAVVVTVDGTVAN